MSYLKLNKEYILNEYDELEDYDLLELISTNSNINNQFLVFVASNLEYYAINVSKIVEILVYKDLKMVKNGGHNLIRGSANIRDSLATIINFDEWFENKVLDDSEYEFVILASYGGYTFGFMVKNVEHIVNIDSNDMHSNSINNAKTNFIANIRINGVNKLCTIFDCDILLADTFKEIYSNNNIDNIKNKIELNKNKIVLFADDSRFIRKIVEKLFIKMQLNFKILENGKELLSELKFLSPNNIGLIITDIEMPVMDGSTLIKEIALLKEYSQIKIIVHTNLSSFIIEESLLNLGVKEVIPKINMQKLSDSITKYLKI
jgi:two-component system, chemotaxis family, chemotaxis protein CheV